MMFLFRQNHHEYSYIFKHITNEEVYELVTSNGGHKPVKLLADKVIQSNSARLFSPNNSTKTNRPAEALAPEKHCC